MSHAQDQPPRREFWGEDLPPLGGEELWISVGGLRVALTGLDAERRDLLDETYAAFVVAPEGEPSMRLRCRRSPRRHFLRLTRGEDHRVESREEGSRFLLWSYAVAAWFDTAAGRGGLDLCDAPTGETRRSFENCLRYLYSHLALEAGGCLLHAAGLVREGRARVLLGAEGSGKSTLAEAASADCEILSDDLVLLIRGEEGYRACGVPFFGTFVSGRSSDQIHPLTSVWALRRAERPGTRELPRSEQRMRLLAAVSFLGHSRRRAAEALERVEELLGVHAVGELRHRGEADFWGLVEAAERSG